MSKPKVELKDELILIHDLKIDDLNTYNILREVKKDRRDDFIEKAIIIGTIGLRNLYLTENVDYIEKEFKGLLNQFGKQSDDIKDMIEETFNIENNASSLGKLRILFEDYFDQRHGKITDLLSPYDEESPIKKLKDEIFKKIQELREELIKEEVTEEITSKTTLKGRKFEDIAIEEIERFCSPYEDKVEFVGDKLGKTNKMGDINIDVDGEERKRIVIECKDSLAYSHRQTLDEINKAIKNRGAEFGIFLFKSQNQIPSALRPIKITNKYIVTSFDDYGLYFSFRVARLFIEKSEKGREEEIPLDKIQKKLEELKGKLILFDGIGLKLTNIDNSSKYIRTNMDKMKNDILEGLESIKELIE